MNWNPPPPPTPGQVGQAIGNAVNQGVNTGTQVVNAAANALNSGGSGAPDPGQLVATAVICLEITLDCAASVVTAGATLAIPMIQVASVAVKLAAVAAVGAASATWTIVENGPVLLDQMGLYNAATGLRRNLAIGDKLASEVIAVAIALEIVLGTIISGGPLCADAVARLLQAAQHLHRANRSQLANSNSATQIPSLIASASKNGAELERLNLTLARDLQHAEHVLRHCTVALAGLPDRRLFHAVHHLQNQLIMSRPKIIRAIETARHAHMQKIVPRTPGPQKRMGFNT